jgi:hypothetical protein
MNDNAQNKPQQQQRPAPDRTPIRIKRLMLWSDKPTMMGIRIPQGEASKGEEQRHDLLAGVQGNDKIEIEHRPWLRVFRIARFRKQTSTGPKGEIETWLPWGDPFHIPDTWAVSIPEEE